MNGLIEHYLTTLPPVGPVPKSNNKYVDRWTKDMQSAFYDPSASGPFKPGPYDQQLSGIFDDLKALVSPYVAAGGAKAKALMQEQLDSAQRSLEEKIGVFLTTGAKLNDLKQRSQAQENSSNKNVRDRAVAISAKASALISNYNNIKTQALTLGTALGALKTQISADPLFNFPNPLEMGTRVVELFNKYKSQVARAVSDSAQMVGRIVAHNKQVDKLASDVSGLESYAQGGGIALLEKVGSGYLDFTGNIAKIAMAGAAIYFLGPTILKSLARKS